MDNHERVRLLLVDGEDTIQGRGGRISHGAAKLVSKWPGYIASAMWFLVFVISLAMLLMVLLFMVIVKEERKINGGNGRYFGKQSFKLNNDFCKEMTSEPGERGLPNIEMFNSENNIFYVRTKPMNKYSSCAVESLLKSSKQKKIFVLMFDKYKQEFENVLKDHYPNLILTKVDGSTYLRGTPFHWVEDNHNKSMIAAGLITIWQFGGTVLSDNLLANNFQGNHTETTRNACIVDYELLSCSEQCEAYVYDFINVVKDNDMSEGAAPIIEKSIANFCGDGAEDCKGVRRAKRICNKPTALPDCEYIRLDNWLDEKPSAEKLSEYCPFTEKYIGIHSHSKNTNHTSTETNTTTAKSNLTQSTPTLPEKNSQPGSTNISKTTTIVTTISSKTTTKAIKK